MLRLSLLGRIGLIAALGTAGAAHAAAEPAAAPAPAAEAAAPAPAPAAPAAPATPQGQAVAAGDEVTCRIMQPTGTRLYKRRICMTRNEWKELTRDAQQRTTSMQSLNPGKLGQ